MSIVKQQAIQNLKKLKELDEVLQDIQVTGRQSCTFYFLEIFAIKMREENDKNIKRLEIIKEEK